MILSTETITACIVLIAVFFWVTEWIPIYATGFLVLFLELVWLLPAFPREEAVSPEFFLSPFFSDTVLLFLGGFVMSRAFHVYGWDRGLAIWIVSKNQSSPFRLLIALVFTTSFFSFWMNNTATAALMLGLSIPLLKGLPPGSGYRKAFLLAIPFASNLGGMGTPVGTLPNALAIEFLTPTGTAPNFLEWILFALPMVLSLDILMIFILWLFFCRNEDPNIRISLSGSNDYEIQMGWKKYFVLFGVVLTVVLWLGSPFHGMSNGTVALVPILLFFGGKLLGLEDFRSLAWDVLILLGGGISLGRAMEKSGLARTLVSGLPIEGADLWVVVVIFSLITIVLSSIMSNTATANLMIPLVLGLGLADTPVVVILVAISASLAMPLPISTPPNAIAFGYGILRSRDMVIPGALVTGLGFLFNISLGYFLLGLL